MSIFFELVRFELKKILRRKRTVIVLAFTVIDRQRGRCFKI